MLGRIEGLVGTLYQLNIAPTYRASLVDGIQNALKWIPTLVDDKDEVLKNRIEELLNCDIETIEQIKAIVLKPEEEEMFIRCGGGLNEKSQKEVAEFIQRTESNK
jgi:hypothetical protein